MTLVFSELLQIVDGPTPDTVKIGFRGNDGRTYSANLQRAILPALAIALKGKCHRSLEDYQTTRAVVQQPLVVISGRTMIRSDHSGAISLLTEVGVEIALESFRF